VTVAESAADARRTALLDAAVRVFLRYGFKKTSMDDLARAAGLSRQGLYLHFQAKEELFKAAVERLLETMERAMRTALDRRDVELDERIVGAFVALHGQYVGQPGWEHATELLETATRLVGPVDHLERQLVDEIAQLLRSTGVAAAWKSAGISAKDLAEQLYVTSLGLKHRATTLDAYRDQMRIAVQLVRGAPKRAR
jgi:AcrR family transcriptional regulator